MAVTGLTTSQNQKVIETMQVGKKGCWHGVCVGGWGWAGLGGWKGQLAVHRPDQGCSAAECGTKPASRLSTMPASRERRIAAAEDGREAAGGVRGRQRGVRPTVQRERSGGGKAGAVPPALPTYSCLTAPQTAPLTLPSPPTLPHSITHPGPSVPKPLVAGG